MGRSKSGRVGRSSVLITCLILFWVSCSTSFADQQPEYRQGQLLVRFVTISGQAPGTAEKQATLDSILTGCSIEREYTVVPGLALVLLPGGTTVADAVGPLGESSSIDYAEPDFVVSAAAVPSDPMFDQLWGMHNTGQTGGAIDADIDAPEAWNMTTGSSDVVIGVIDTGVDYTHPDLAGNMWVNQAELDGQAGQDDDGNGYVDDIYGYDFANGNGDPYDDHGHGTHCSGTIGAVANNSQGVAGVCWQVRIMALKFLGADGFGVMSDAVGCIEYAVQMNAHLTSNSWGGIGYSQAVHDAIAAAGAQGQLFVAAAGNYSWDNDIYPHYPSNYELANIIAVMATDHFDQRSSFSNWGRTNVDLGAPGTDIYSCEPGGGYVNMSGTSMACPHVAGACGLMWAAEPALQYFEIKDILLATVDERLSGLCVSDGRLNLAAAIEEVYRDTMAPTPDPARWDIEPQATGLHTIVMQAEKAIDRSGVEYYFECSTDPGFDSGWQDSSVYVGGGFSEGQTYEFRVKARDKSSDLNETRWSPSASATTATGADDLAPAPDPARWDARPKLIRLTPIPRVRMRAYAAFDENGPAEYFFRCLDSTDPDLPTPAVFDSGWMAGNTYSIESDQLVEGETYTFYVKARDQLGNETEWSQQASVGITIDGSKVLSVPVPYATIQAALDAAGNGDTVEVRPGTYLGVGNTNLDFTGKAITLRSTDPENPTIIASTIIECDSSSRGFIFENGEGRDSVVSGFTIRNGYIHNGGANGFMPGDPGVNGELSTGGGIQCEGSSPTIRNCVITNCVADGSGGDGAPGDGSDSLPGGDGGTAGPAFGGAIYCDATSNPIIENCQITGCRVISNGGRGGDGDYDGEGGIGGSGGDPNEACGGAIYCENTESVPASNASIIDCVITGSVVEAVRGDGGLGDMSGLPGAALQPDGRIHGGGIYIGEGNAGDISDIVLSDNTTGRNGGGLYAGEGSAINLTGCEISSNAALEQDGGGLYLDLQSNPELRECVISENSAGVDGGGIRYAGEGTLTIDNCQISGNTASGEYAAGGGVCAGYVDPESPTHLILKRSTVLQENTAKFGGGLYVEMATVDISLTKLIDNTAWDGGGLWCYDCSSEIDRCRFEGNTGAGQGYACGGALTNYNGLLTVTCTDFEKNLSDGGGGAAFLDGWSDTPHQFINCLMAHNSATWDGGALSCNRGAWAVLESCTIFGNSVGAIQGAGGAVSCAEEFAYTEIINSILWANTARNGDQIAVGRPDGSIFNPCADVDVSYTDLEGGPDEVFLEGPDTVLWWLGGNIEAEPVFARTESGRQQYYLSQVAAGQLTDSPALDAGFGDVSMLASAVGLEPNYLTTRSDHLPDANAIDMGYHYRVGAGPVQYNLEILVYFDGYGSDGQLRAEGAGSQQFEIWQDQSQLVAQGTVVDLFAVPDSGFRVRRWSDTDNDRSTANTNTVTMDSDKQVVVEFEPVGLYKLITSVSSDNGTISPPGRTFHAPDTVVSLMATPNDPTSQIRWSGTDADYDTGLTNTVTMDDHKEVVVEFFKGRVLNVPGDYTNIQLAINDAKDNDTILIAPGTYDITDSSYQEPPLQPLETEYLIISGKKITISSVDPDDPSVVAATVITDGGLVIEDVDRSTVIDGITIQNAHYSGNDNWHLLGYRDTYTQSGKAYGLNSKWATPSGSGLDGPGGHLGDTYGGAIELRDTLLDSTAPGTPCVTSPLIRNCQFINCSANGVHGGDGNGGADDEGYGGQGGWGGAACGGGIYCGANSSPIIMNCSFVGCWARGGDGGNGGDNPNGHGGSWGDPLAPWWWEYGPFEDEWKYSGYGGAAYCDVGSSPEFVDCNFVDNYSYGGSCGISGGPGQVTGWPYEHYRIDRFGGAVYANAGSTPVFNGCNFINNETDVDGPEFWNAGRSSQSSNVHSYDSCLSYGGALAFEDGAKPRIINCTFSSNLAHLGGALYERWADWEITDCLVANNSGYHGGGVYLMGGSGRTVGTTLKQNTATAEVAQGGAVYIFDANSVLYDCELNQNTAVGSGGAVYGAGQAELLFKNCLVTDNQAGRDGGAMSINWYSEPNIVNCTFNGNKATGAEPFGSGKGGAFYCGYSSNAKLLNSILWGNGGMNTVGLELAVGTGYEFEPRPGTVTVEYCDVKGGQQGVYVEQDCTLNWLEGNIDDDPLFVEDTYYLSQIAAGQAVDSNCVNAGSDWAEVFGLHLKSTRSDGGPDTGLVDMGYHYPMVRTLTCDFDYDGDVDYCDLRRLLEHWLDEDCGPPDWCCGADLDSDGKIDLADYTLFACEYEPSDEFPPQPNPSQWAVEPNAISTSSIAMQAVAASDDSGPVQYYFECTQGTEVGGDDSGWQGEATYTDTGLTVGEVYCYRVKTRDSSWRENESGWSETVCEIVPAETYPPEPDPSTWKVQPYESSDFVISMTATPATDLSGGVEYMFICTSAGYDSGWRSSNSWQDTVDQDETMYCYQVKTRDMYWNESRLSEQKCVSIDHKAPQPDPLTWESEPSAASPFAITMTATEASDLSGGVEYQFECVGGPGHSSDWQSSRVYEDTGLVENTTYEYKVRARDPAGNVGDYSVVAGATTFLDNESPTPDPAEWNLQPYVASATSVAMSAATASDPSGVEYRFECTGGAGQSSGWQDDRFYEDTGLSEGQSCTYRVQARDKSQAANTTAFSQEISITVDVTPPTPDPAEWQTLPYEYEQDGNYYHKMTAAAGSDISGVWYQFRWIDDQANQGESDWQQEATFTKHVPEAGLQYGYWVRMRDGANPANIGQWTDSPAWVQ